MIPPSYSDLDKQIRNLFKEGYHCGLWKIGCRTTTENGVEFTTSGQLHTDTGKLFGSVETKRTFLDNSLCSVNKWASNRTLYTDITMQDKLIDGLKIGIVSAFKPNNNSVKFKAKMTYGCKHLKLDTESVIAYRPLLNLAIVFAYEGFYFGRQVAFDTETLTAPINNVALGYITNSFAVHSAVSDCEQYLTSVFHKVSDLLEVGLHLSWFSEFKNVKLGLGSKLQLDNKSALRVKLDNTCQLGLGYQRRFHNGITLFLSAMINCSKLNSNDHKVGAAIEVEF